MGMLYLYQSFPNTRRRAADLHQQTDVLPVADVASAQSAGGPLALAERVEGPVGGGEAGQRAGFVTPARSHVHGHRLGGRTGTAQVRRRTDLLRAQTWRTEMEGRFGLIGKIR